MNRIDRTFATLKSSGKKALITFVTAGDPDLETTVSLVLAMEKAGADIIELGVPFSDPVAEGPIIQAASQRALLNGCRLEDIFQMVATLRQQTQIPLLFMMYLNSIYVYGKERFFAKCQQVGIDGVIVPDMPFEERDEIQPEARNHGVYSISLVAPTSGDRIKAIAEQCEGFIYCVSSLGVTGVRSAFETDFPSFFHEIYKYAKVPAALGFGISTPKQAKELSQYCDGIIVGSAIVNLVAEYGKSAPKPVADFVQSFDPRD